MTYDTEKIVEDQIAWGKTTLPGYGVSMTMILNNFKRYNVALKNKLPGGAYKEVQPYLESMINRQSIVAKETHVNKAR